MEKEALRRLEKENQLQLNEAQQETVLAFLNGQLSEIEKLSHLLPGLTPRKEEDKK